MRILSDMHHFLLVLFLLFQIKPQECPTPTEPESEQPPTAPSKEGSAYLNTLFAEFDSDFNDYLDPREFKHFAQSYWEKMSDQDLQRTRQLLDENKDILIQRKQFVKLVEMEEKEYQSSINTMAHEMDKNGDGFIDRAEYAQFVKENDLEQDQPGQEDEEANWKIPVDQIFEMVLKRGEQMVDGLDMEQFFTDDQINGSVFQNYEDLEDKVVDTIDL